VKSWTIVLIYTDSTESGVSWETAETTEAAVAKLRNESDDIQVVAAFEGHHNDVTDHDTRDFE